MRILSNNIYWLQGYPSPNNQPDPASLTVLEELKRHYDALQVDIICLQEIQNIETYILLANSLGRSGVYCPGQRYAWYGGAVFAEHAELCDSSSQRNDDSDRFWAHAQIQHAGTTCSIVTLHLPSNLNRDNASATQKRQQELTQILENKHPDIICGDFNQIANQWLSHCMAAHGYSDAAVLSNCANAASCAKSANRIDYFWVKDCHAQKVNSLSHTLAKDFTSTAPGRRFISDHVPVVLDIDL